MDGNPRLVVAARRPKGQCRTHRQSGMDDPANTVQFAGRRAGVGQFACDGGASDDDLGLGAEPAHDVARVDDQTDAQGHVDPLLDELVNRIVEEKIDFHAAILPRQSCGNGCNHRRKGLIDRQCHPQGSRGRRPVPLGDLFELMDGREYVLCRSEHPFPDLCETKAARAAHLSGMNPGDSPVASSSSFLCGATVAADSPMGSRTCNGAEIVVAYIENEAKVAQVTKGYLEAHGLRVIIAESGRDGIACVVRERPDIVLLELLVPDLSGIELCRTLRERTSAPIVIVTSLCEEADRVMALEGGADDYVTKPFSLRELLARLRAKARRARAIPGRDTLSLGALTIERASRVAHWKGQAISLTSYEFDLLRVLVERAGRVLSREQLMDLVRGRGDEALERTIDAHVCRLRAKLGDDPRRPHWLKTIRGVGYTFATQFG